MAMKTASKRSTAPRLRKAEACFPCNRTKHRCDAAQPACTPCVKTGKYCEYRNQRRGAPSSVERVVQFDPKRLPMIPGNDEQRSTMLRAPYNLQPSHLPVPPLLSSDMSFPSYPQTTDLPKLATAVLPAALGLPTSPPLKSSSSSATTTKSPSMSDIILVPPHLPPFNPQAPHALRPLLTLEPDPLFPRNPPPLFIDGNGKLRHARWDDI
ncbi:hypothetical protein BS47DRAFT_1481644 [Hydnum rufescens UP504]|uniref:Zn(2)-C6 fungal-type domain-containing protein n=1 Tax=Hydnum rufescens UP504 TaxID=1448309 RepID=A0A9P6BA23_9AGAM|nr:hypothetical protein BS47DRAFT_1481644 [Hydnum rufescens UP504]